MKTNEDNVSNLFDLFRTTQIRHHNPSPGYKYLYAYPVYRRLRSIICKHKNVGLFSVEDSDPRWMKTTYHHTVCKDCGKLLMVNGEKYKKIRGMRR